MGTATTALRGRIRSVNVGPARDVPHKGKIVRTAIFKSPVAGPVRVAGVNIEGDAQADPKHHGGPDMAVYAFPAEHYDRWTPTYPEIEAQWGAFGENLTTEGLHERNTCVGDRFRCGSAELLVTAPRRPCAKLALRLGDPAAVKTMLELGTSGFYLSIAVEGRLEAGDTIERVHADPRRVTIADINGLYDGSLADAEIAARAMRVEALPESWKDAIARRLDADR